MKKSLKIRNLVSSVIHKIDSFFGLNKNTTVVLCFHSFSNSANRYAVKAKVFEEQMLKISKNSEFIGINQIDDIINKKVNSGLRVMVTIDDGFENVLDILPITRKYKIPVLLFVLSNPNNANRGQLENKESLLSWSKIKYLQKEGWTIGSHSSTHTDFSKLRGRDLLSEITKTKAVLERKLNTPVTAFAYPKGFFNEEIVKTVKQAGFKYGFSIKPGFINSKSNNFILPRTIIDSTHNVSEIPSVYSHSWFLLRKITAPLKLWEKLIK